MQIYNLNRRNINKKLNIKIVYSYLELSPNVGSVSKAPGAVFQTILLRSG